ncbi:L,D-transpeptidase [Haloferula sargassicola]|uniref:L,D-TPase catalytic domain-containing protein n=1 Tax=Haloferula sargassicola TaxID=490096 RepID=A0ABP9UJ47_9BACT
MTQKLRILLLQAGLILGCAVISSCGTSRDDHNKMLVSVRDQQMLLVRDGKPVKAYKVSTSKFGLGSRSGSNCTPLGYMEVARKIGDGAPSGMVFKGRRPTGEVLRPNEPGRDPIVGRILWLHGKESQNRNTFGRCIYIHGTPEEWRLGSPASYGCIRMAQRDVVDLYNRVGVGAEVRVIRGSLLTTREGLQYAQKQGNDRYRGYTAFHP